MDVTKSNFQTVLQSLDEELAACTFLSIDTEFTGLHDTDERMSAMHTPRERYEFLRQTSMRFLVVQFGLGIFTYEPQSKKYLYKTFNFYIFPNPNPPPGLGYPDPRFMCQASSLGFLVAYGFDFNKLIKEGIPYLTLADEERVRSVMAEKLKQAATPTHNHIPSIPAEQKEFMESTMAQIRAFLDGKEEQLVIENSSAFQRKLIFTHGRAQFSEAFFESKMNDKQERLLVVRRNAPDPQLQEANRQLDNEQQLENAVGFTRVLTKITESGKLVVGHNVLLDVCHILHQFYGQLPEDYDEFKTLVNSVFPKLIDTKVMAGTNPFRDRLPNSALEPLAKTLSGKPFRLGAVEPAENFAAYSLESDKAHEAGYDAFLTGLCFISMCNFLGDLSDSYERILPDSSFIPPFLQKVHLMRVQDIPYMNLADADLEPDRDHVFHMTFPKGWITQDIFALFSVYGPVTVNWQSDTAAYVVLLRREHRELILKNVTPPPGCTLVPYHVHVAAARSAARSAARGATEAAETVETASVTRRKKRSGPAAPSPAPPKKAKRPAAADAADAGGGGGEEAPSTPTPQGHFQVPDNWD